jgi:hypothetical protein
MDWRAYRTRQGDLWSTIVRWVRYSVVAGSVEAKDFYPPLAAHSLVEVMVYGYKTAVVVEVTAHGCMPAVADVAAEVRVHGSHIAAAEERAKRIDRSLQLEELGKLIFHSFQLECQERAMPIDQSSVIAERMRIAVVADRIAAVDRTRFACMAAAAGVVAAGRTGGSGTRVEVVEPGIADTGPDLGEVEARQTAEGEEPAAHTVLEVLPRSQT